MKRRQLKVYQQGDPYWKTDQPQIRFGGQWLREAGFQPGDPYQLTVHAEGVLTISLSRPHAYEEGIKPIVGSHRQPIRCTSPTLPETGEGRAPKIQGVRGR